MPSASSCLMISTIFCLAQMTPFITQYSDPDSTKALVESGSLYWVIKGVICARQKIVEIIKQEDADGMKRCRIYLDNLIIKTTPIRKRPFQGWRYLKKNRTPADIVDPVTATFDEDIPLEVQQQLLEVGPNFQ